MVVNADLGADFDLDAFDHVAVWDPAQEWIEMRLRSAQRQQVRLPAIGLTVSFAEGEAKGPIAKFLDAPRIAKLKEIKDVVELPSGLRYEIIEPGTGTPPKATDTVPSSLRTNRAGNSERAPNVSRVCTPSSEAATGLIAGDPQNQ